MPEAVGRRLLVAGAAWTVPVILVGEPAAAAACSPRDEVPYTPTLAITSSTATKPVNGHTLGTFVWNVCNAGSNTLPAGTTYTAVFAADKAPGTASKNILVTPRTTTSPFTVSPPGPRTLNPDGPPKGEATVTVSLVLASSLAPGACVEQIWDIDSETGVGATQLRMTISLVSYGGGGCGTTGGGGEATETAIWGANG
ncbi:MAG TPA: hypothetical protein VFI44_11715 [Ornithinibacter sp.]|nr:hypothetical protein [Ornithinibacter sp.]